MNHTKKVLEDDTSNNLIATGALVGSLIKAGGVEVEEGLTNQLTPMFGYYTVDETEEILKDFLGL